MHTRSVPLKQWSEEDLKLACKAVSDGCSIRKAADKFEVPKSTLYDRISGRIAFGAKLEWAPSILECQGRGRTG